MQIKLIKNAETSRTDINTAISLKEQYWKYGEASQRNWIEKNLLPQDIHCFFLTDSGEAVAYMNVVCVKAEFDNVCEDFFGVGNLCVKREYSGRGYAKGLLNGFFASPDMPSKPGLLLCHENLTGFYKKSGWVVQNYGQAMVGDEPYLLSIMTSGFGVNIKSKEIHIEKNF